MTVNNNGYFDILSTPLPDYLLNESSNPEPFDNVTTLPEINFLEALDPIKKNAWEVLCNSHLKEEAQQMILENDSSNLRRPLWNLIYQNKPENLPLIKAIVNLRGINVLVESVQYKLADGRLMTHLPLICQIMGTGCLEFVKYAIELFGKNVHNSTAIKNLLKDKTPDVFGIFVRFLKKTSTDHFEVLDYITETLGIETLMNLKLDSGPNAGLNPLHLACFQGDRDIKNWLLDKFANWGIDPYKHKAIKSAASSGNFIGWTPSHAYFLTIFEQPDVFPSITKPLTESGYNLTKKAKNYMPSLPATSGLHFGYHPIHIACAAKKYNLVLRILAIKGPSCLQIPVSEGLCKGKLPTDFMEDKNHPFAEFLQAFVRFPKNIQEFLITCRPGECLPNLEKLHSSQDPYALNLFSLLIETFKNITTQGQQDPSDEEISKIFSYTDHPFLQFIGLNFCEYTLLISTETMVVNEFLKTIHNVPELIYSTNGKCKGLSIFHIACLRADSTILRDLIKLYGSDGIQSIAKEGPFEGLSVEEFCLTYGSDVNKKLLKTVKNDHPIEAKIAKLPENSAPEIPNNPTKGMNFKNFNTWKNQKIKELKKNPRPLLESLKRAGRCDFSDYGEQFMHNKARYSLFPHFSNSTWIPKTNYQNELTDPQFLLPRETLQKVAGAAYHLYLTLISVPVESKNNNCTSIPLLVYTQNRHEIRAYILLGIFYESPHSLISVVRDNDKKTENLLKEILGESSYSIENDQISMDLQGFEKLTDFMKKPGLGLLMCPVMKDPEADETESHPQAASKRSQAERNPYEPSPDPSTRKRLPITSSQKSKRLKITQGAQNPPSYKGVDKRMEITDGAQQTEIAKEEKLTKPSTRNEDGRLIQLNENKTLDMPAIELDPSDPAAAIKQLLKGSLEDTLSNLKTAKARNDLIQNKPLPLPVVDSLRKVKSQSGIPTLTQLKNYQKDALEQILALSKVGLMPLLSLEMGLGKTYVFREWVLQQILLNGGGKHLIIVPASLTKQTHEVFQSCLEELITYVRQINRHQRENDLGVSRKDLVHLLKFPPTAILAPNGKELNSALAKEHAIIIVSYDNLPKLLEAVNSDQFLTIVADEAQRVHNEKSQISDTVKTLMQKQRDDRFRLLMVTATPYENDMTELWTLLASANRSLFPSETLNTLKLGFKKVKESLVDSIQGDFINPDLIINCYAHFTALKEVLEKLVIFKRTSDPQVVLDWDGKVPTREDEFPIIELETGAARALNQAASQLMDHKIGHLQFTAQSNAALIHTSLIGQSIRETSIPVQELYRKAENDNLEELLQESAFLTFLFGQSNPILQQSYDDKVNTIIFVDHIVTGQLIQRIAQRIFRQEVQFFNGQCTPQERSALTKWFETPSEEARVMILSMGAGGVGLNLPSAKKVIDLSQEYNIASHNQAAARAIRANNEGTVRVITPLFKGSFYQGHVRAHHEMKSQWINFLFNNGGFTSFLEAAISESKIALLNVKRDVDQVERDEITIREALSFVEPDFTEDKIQQAVKNVAHQEYENIDPMEISSFEELEAARPTVPVVARTLDPNHYFTITLPYNMTRDQAISLARAFHTEEHSDLIRDFMATKRVVDQQRIPPDVIRNANPEALNSLPSSYLRRIQRILSKSSLQGSSHANEYLYRGDMNPPKFQQANPDEMESDLLLYKKMLPGGKSHYEPLVLRK